MTGEETTEAREQQTSQSTEKQAEEVTEKQPRQEREKQTTHWEKEQPTQRTEKKQRQRSDDNTVYIGKKGTMAYVLAVVTQANNGNGDVTIKARGKAISRAVDVAEIVRNKFIKDLKVDSIKIATEEVSSEDGNKVKVSAIEIFLKK